MNKKLFRQVADRIVKNPKLYNQDSFCTTGSCGSEFCVAGWVLVLSGYTEKQIRQLQNIRFDWCGFDNPIPLIASKILQIEERIAAILFSSANVWPEEYAKAFDKADSAVKQARVTYNFIYDIINNKVDWSTGG